MEFFLDDKVKEMYECQECGRLFLRGKTESFFRWYAPGEGQAYFTEGELMRHFPALFRDKE